MIFSVILALLLVFALAACDSGSKPAANNTGSGGGSSGGSNAVQPSGPDRYYKYVGGESLKDASKLVVPTVGYNVNSFEYPNFIEAFRY